MSRKNWRKKGGEKNWRKGRRDEGEERRKGRRWWE